MTDKSFLEWMINPEVLKEIKEGKPKEEPAKDEKPVTEGISTEPATGDEPHMVLGKSLAEFGLKQRAKDIDGFGALKHGSPWIADIANLEKLFQGLRKKGYLSSIPTSKQLNPKKGASFKKPQSPVMVEMGIDAKNVYLYITDDNEKKK
jgi:hypothetical protein